MATIYQDQLLTLIDRHFNDEKLRTLCFALTVDYDNLGGRGKAANARELIALLQRQNRLPTLLEHLRQLHPTVDWPDPPSVDNHAARQALQAQAQTLFAQARGWLSPHVRQREVADLLAESIHLPQTAEDAAELADDSAIERETAAYLTLHNDLLQHYEGQYIALHHGEVMAHGPDFGAVYNEVNRAYPHEFVLIRRVEPDPDPVYHFC